MSNPYPQIAQIQSSSDPGIAPTSWNAPPMESQVPTGPTKWEGDEHATGGVTSIGYNDDLGANEIPIGDPDSETDNGSGIWLVALALLYLGRKR